MVGGLIIKNRKREGFFCKRIKRVEGLFWKKRKRAGAQGKIALLPPLSRTVERRGRTAAALAGGLGRGGGREVGEKNEESKGFYSPYYLGLGWSGEARPRWPDGGGGGASGWRRWEAREGGARWWASRGDGGLGGRPTYRPGGARRRGGHTAAAGRWGERMRRARGFYSPYYLGLRWSGEAHPQWLAGGGGGASGRRRWEARKGGVRWWVSRGDGGLGGGPTYRPGGARRRGESGGWPVSSRVGD
jgi:hypothetical protein